VRLYPLAKYKVYYLIENGIKEYSTGLKTIKTQLDEKRISYHPNIPELNYRFYP
jgi:hypothetical protein